VRADIQGTQEGNLFLPAALASPAPGPHWR
jgi:hypothetical protein